MDEQVIDDLYSRAKSQGYTKSREEFIKLLHTDNQVFDDMFSYVKSKGYNKDAVSFEALIGKTKGVVAPQQIEQPVAPPKKKGTMDLYSGEPLSGSSFPNQQIPAESTGVARPQVQSFDQIQSKGSAQQRTQFLQPKLDVINPDLINAEEEEVVEKLRKEFGTLGFKFEESGASGDWVTVTAPNGKTKEFGLDPFMGIGAQGKADELKNWMRQSVASLDDNQIKIVEEGLRNQEKIIKEQERQLKEEKIKRRKMLDEAPKEEDFFKGTFGDVLKAIDTPIPGINMSLGIGDFIDDFGRSLYAGYKNGAIATPSNKLMIGGKYASKEEIQKFIKAAEEMQGIGPSDEMVNFSKVYEDEGGDFWAVIKGLAQNPGAIPELMVSSISAMLNSSSATAAGAVLATGTSAGAVAGLPAGGVGAAPGAVSGFLSSIPYAVGAAGTALETGLTFGELLQDELKKRNLEFNEENVKKILEDTGTLDDIRVKSLSRGVTIGAIDALTGRIAGRVGAKLIGNTAASKIKAGLASSAIEAAGGSAGEAAGRGVAGQEMDVAEIALEGLAEMPMAGLDIASEVLQKPIFKVNGEIRSESDIQQIIKTASPEDLSKIKLEIKNDKKGYKAQIEDKIQTGQIKSEIKNANPDIDENSLNELVELEKELKKFDGSRTQSGKDKAASIRSQIKQIQENAVQKPKTDESVLRTGQAGVGLQGVGEENKPVQANTIEEISDEQKKKDLISFIESEEKYLADEANSETNSEGIRELYSKRLEELKSNPIAYIKRQREELSKNVDDKGNVKYPTLLESFNSAYSWTINQPKQQTAQSSAKVEKTQINATSIEGLPTDVKVNTEFTQEDGTVSPVMGNEKMLSDMYNQAISTPQQQRTDAQNKVVSLVDGFIPAIETNTLTKTIEDISSDISFDIPLQQWDNLVDLAGRDVTEGTTSRQIAVSYQKAKSDNSNPELVKAVDDLIKSYDAFKQKPSAVQETPRLARDISVLITPATVRSFSRKTKRISKLSKKYDELVNVYNKTKDEKVNKKIKELELQILEQVKKEIAAEVSKVQGVSVSFAENKRGLFAGVFEPSLNMTLSITPQADTEAASNLLFDFAEKYSQDSFIIETTSQLNDDFVDGKIPAPLGDVDSDGLTNYPQLIYTFANPITDEQLASISVELKNSGVGAFSINNNGLQVSVIPSLSKEQQKLSQDEQRTAKKQYFKDQSDATSSSVRNVLGDDGLSQYNIKIQKSTYVGAINEGSQDATRKYDRSNVLQAFQSGVSKVEKLAAEYNTLRQKEIELSKTKQKLSPEEQKRLDELSAQVQPTVQKTFAANREMYKQAKLDAEKIAKSAIKGINAFVSRFPIKRAERASVKTMRWYNSFTENLGDGARLNIIVRNSQDADAVYEEISKQFPQGTDTELRRIKETTELGYPKRLIELRMPNGVIAEFQIMTPEAYLAKDGLGGYEEGRREFAKKELEKVRNRLGWNIPDGLGHYFYEIQRDYNVDDSLREEAQRLSNLYYDAFTNPDSNLSESFMNDVIAFKEKVDASDKSTWDKGNEGKAPKSLVEYSKTFTPTDNTSVSRQQMTSFNEGIESVRKNAEEYRNKINDKKQRPNQPIFKLFKDVSKLISKAYESIVNNPNDSRVKSAYDAMIKETLDQFDFILSKGLKVVKHEGVGEPYANSAEMLRDLKENNTLKFLPNDVAYGQGDTQVSDNIGLQPSGRKLDDGYELTNSEVFRIVHDYFGHGILGNQFGPVGEENATLQHLDLYSNKAAPAVIFQTRGQNSWVNFSGENARAIQLRQQAKQLNKEGKTEEANKLLEEANKIFKFAEPKIAIFPNIFNFKRYETARRISESSGIDNRADKRNQDLPLLLEKYSNRSRRTRGVNKRDIREVKRLGRFDVVPIAEYTFDDTVSDQIKQAFPQFKGTQKVYEITDGNVFRELMIENLEGNKYKTSVTIHSARDFQNMRMFVTEDGKTGITISKDGYLGGGFSKKEAGNENALSQLIILGIKEGATTADAFDTVLPDYYSAFGFKAVARLEFNEDFKPEGWSYEDYKKFNNGRPDVVFFIYDGGDRNTIEERLGLFDDYKTYDKENAKFFDKDSFDDAQEFMMQSAVKRLEFELGVDVPIEDLPGYYRLQTEINGIIERSKKRGADKNRIAENVMNYVINSKVYADASDTQRELLVRKVREDFGIKEKQAPSVGRLFGTIKDITKITMTEKTALAKQIKDLARGAKDAARAWRDANQYVTKEVKKLASTGKISPKQAANILRKFAGVNILSPRSVSKFVTYISNVFKDAEYAKKLSDSNSLRNDISKLSKVAEKDANLRALGQKFLEIDPSMVENIDEYKAMATQIKDSLVGSVRRKDKISLVSMVSIDNASSYIDATLKAQEEKLRQEVADELQEMMGVDFSQFSYEDMISLLDKKEPITKYDEGIIRSTINKAFEIYSTMIKKAIDTGKDPFTDAPFELTDTQKRVIRAFMEIDTNRLDVKEAIRVIDALNNFLQNKSTARMESVVSEYTGKLNAAKVRARKIQAIRLRKNYSPWLGRVLAEYTTNIGPLFERMFKGVKRGGFVEDMMGLTKVKNGKALAERLANNLAKEYMKSFYKRKANGKKFNSAYNNIERGMIAFLSRNVVGTDAQMKAEFKRRKDLIAESISELESGNKIEREKAELYQQIYDKLGVEGAQDADQIRANADPVNIEAVDWWTNEWDKIYPELSDLSLNVYNKVLRKDSYFNPDRFSKLSNAGDGKDLLPDESVFHYNSGAIFIPRQTGTLMDASFPSELPKGEYGAERYIDLSFDNNNANSMYDALVDLNTASAMRQVNSFFKSPDMKYIVPESKDRKLLKRRIDLYFQKVRNKEPFSDDELANGVKRLNKIAALGVGQSLGGVTMPLKQVVPVMFNTLTNAGRLDMGALFDKSKNDFMRRCGYAIANRGISSQAQIESINRLLEEAATSAAGKTFDLISKANDLWLKAFLVAPDAWVARASWLTFYEKSLREQGINPSSIDWDTHEVNEEAGNYAQRMLDRQQNISDPDQAGKLFASTENPTLTLATKILMPFASFRMNQATRLGNDLSTIGHWSTSTTEDKVIAARSLAGYAVEMAVFRTLQAGILIALGSFAKELMGDDEDDEELEERINNALKGQTTSTVTDLFSYAPVLDRPVQGAAAWMSDFIQNTLEVEEEDKLDLIYKPKAPDFIKSLGLFGITAERGMQLWELTNTTSLGGSFTDNFGNEKYLNQEDQEKLQPFIGLAFLSSIGILPSEANSIVRTAFRDAKKRSSKTEGGKSQYQVSTDKAKERETEENKEESQENKMEKIEALEKMLKRGGNPDRIEEIEERLRILNMSKEDKKKYDEQTKGERLKENQQVEELLGGYDNKEDLKRYNPRLYERNFGKRSQYYKDNRYEIEVQSQLNKMIRKEKDKENRYTPKSKRKGWNDTEYNKRRSSSTRTVRDADGNVIRSTTRTRNWE